MFFENNKLETLQSKGLDDHSNTSVFSEKNNKINDKLLWNSFKEGNKKAFQYIYSENFDILFKYGLTITINKKLVEDEIQGFFIYLWNKKQNLTIKHSITNYLIFAFRYRLIRAITKENKSKSLPEWESQYIEEVEILDQNYLSHIKNTIDMLPIKQREIIHLKYFQSLSGSEIAEIMEISQGGAYNLLSRAISNLKKKLLKKTEPS